MLALSWLSEGGREEGSSHSSPSGAWGGVGISTHFRTRKLAFQRGEEASAQGVTALSIRPELWCQGPSREVLRRACATPLPGGSASLVLNVLEDHICQHVGPDPTPRGRRGGGSLTSVLPVPRTLTRGVGSEAPWGRQRSVDPAWALPTFSRQCLLSWPQGR